MKIRKIAFLILLLTLFLLNLPILDISASLSGFAKSFPYTHGLDHVSHGMLEMSENMKQMAVRWHRENNFTASPVRLQQCGLLSNKLNELVLVTPELQHEPIIYIFVNSAPQNVNERSIIRQMFSEVKIGKKLFQIVFSVGLSQDLHVNLKVIQECRCQKDVLLLSVFDSYKFLTLKTFADIQVRTSEFFSLLFPEIREFIRLKHQWIPINNSKWMIEWLSILCFWLITPRLQYICLKLFHY